MKISDQLEVWDLMELMGLLLIGQYFSSKTRELFFFSLFLLPMGACTKERVFKRV